jgi:hypothetical protein
MTWLRLTMWTITLPVVSLAITGVAVGVAVGLGAFAAIGSCLQPRASVRSVIAARVIVFGIVHFLK